MLIDRTERTVTETQWRKSREAPMGRRGVTETLRRVVLPALAPALLAGFAAALARGVGEYGSVIFIAGNMPLISEIAPLLIVIRLEQLDYAGAAALGLIMLMVSFAILLLLNLLQKRIGVRMR